MLTYHEGTQKDARPSYRPYAVTVSRLVDLGPSLRRVTFTGEALDGFGTDGLDQRIKIVFPVDGGFGSLDWHGEDVLTTGGWYSLWRDLPDAERAPFRTYTVRAVRPEVLELDVDFVVHAPSTDGTDGPAARWITRATVGDEVIVVGPDARSIHSAQGIDWHPGDATCVLLAGDETAAPAIASILESLPAGIRASAFIEVPHAADAQPLVVAADVDLQWIARDAGPDRLEHAVREWLVTHRADYAPALSSITQVVEDVDVDVELIWDSPEAGRGSFYAWLAGESAVIKSLRRLLVTETGIDRSRVAFMGYWRQGRSEAQ